MVELEPKIASEWEVPTVGCHGLKERESVPLRGIAEHGLVRARELPVRSLY